MPKTPKHNRLPRVNKRGNKKAEAECKDRIDILLNILIEKGEMNSTDLRRCLGVSTKTFSIYIKRLQRQKLIEGFKKTEDIRENWYRISPENYSHVKLILDKVLWYEKYVSLSDSVRNASQRQKVLALLEKFRKENEAEDYQREEQAKSEILDDLKKEIKL